MREKEARAAQPACPATSAIARRLKEEKEEEEEEQEEFRQQLVSASAMAVAAADEAPSALAAVDARTAARTPAAAVYDPSSPAGSPLGLAVFLHRPWWHHYLEGRPIRVVYRCSPRHPPATVRAAPRGRGGWWGTPRGRGGQGRWGRIAAARARCWRRSA